MPTSTHRASTKAVVILVSVVALLLAASVVRAAQLANILVLQSYHVGYAWTDEVTRGLEERLLSAAPEVGARLQSLYMDTKRIKDPDYFTRLAGHYRYLQTKGLGPIDIVIAVDNDAFDFMLGPGRAVFGAVPVVFCGVNDPPPQLQERYPQLTGVEEDLSLQDTLELMKRLHPKATTIYVIHDRTTTGTTLRHQLEELQMTRPLGATLRFPKRYDLPGLLQEVAELPDDSMILFTDFNRGPEGYVDYREVLRQVRLATTRPIYGLWDFQVGRGVVGGRVVSGKIQGQLAAGLVLRILKGERPADIPIIRESPNPWMFDYRQLENHGISVASLPEHSILLNQPLLKYRKIIMGGAVAIVILTTAVLVLGVNIHRRKVAETLLVQAQLELEQKVRQRTFALRSTNRKLRWEVKERQRAEEEIRRLAYHDDLTGLPNRTLFKDRLEQSLARAERGGRHLALLFFDLDHFKYVNDTFGHSTGDELLQRVAQRVEPLIRKTDTFARFAGDEFVVVLDNVSGWEPAERIASEICTVLGEPFPLDRVSLMVSCSVGIALYPDNGTDMETLLKNADTAMYKAKRQGRNRYQCYGASLSLPCRGEDASS